MPAFGLLVSSAVVLITYQIICLLRKIVVSSRSAGYKMQCFPCVVPI